MATHSLVSHAVQRRSGGLNSQDLTGGFMRCLTAMRGEGERVDDYATSLSVCHLFLQL
jgi:hypothetical protein